MKSKRVADSKVVMTELVLTEHTNIFDSIFGGVVMSWIDIAGAIAAQRHSGKEVVTASVDDLHFFAPVYKGWVANLRASVNYVAKTSMEVGVRVDAENPKTGEHFHTSSAYLTFVALDSFGKPTQVPGLIAETEDEKRRFRDGETRRKLRLERRELFKK